VLGPVSAVAAQFGALLAMRSILNLGGDAAGQLFLLDAVSLKWKMIDLPKDPGCRTCAAAAA
jgi:hypothetical protein